MSRPIAYSKWEFRTSEGVFIQVSETEDFKHVLLTIARIDHDNRRMIESSVMLNKDEWETLQSLSYSPKINFIEEELANEPS